MKQNYAWGGNMNTKKEKKKMSIDFKFVLLAVTIIIIFCAIISPITLQNDTYYTIKIGDDIINNYGVDMQDHYSWHDNLPYYYPHWLYDVIIYLIFSLGGMKGIYISTVVLACILGTLIFFLNCKLSKNKLTSFFITLGMMYLLKDFIAARAQLVTYIMFILEIWCIEAFLDTKKTRYMISLVGIAIIIANVHSAVWPLFFVFFLPYIVSYLWTYLVSANLWYRMQIQCNNFIIKLCKNSKKNKKDKIEKCNSNIEELKNRINIANEKRNKRNENPYRIQMERNKNIKWLIFIAVICAFTGLLTPIGDMPYTYLTRTLQGKTTTYISEHLPLTLADDKFTACMLVMFLSIIVFTDTKIKLRDLFMMSGLIILAFLSRRQTSMLVLVGGLILNKLVATLFEKYDKDGSNKILKQIVTPTGTIISLLLLALIVISQYKTKKNDTFINESAYPVQAADYIIENLDVNNIRLYNEYNYGSYLLYRGIPVFIDSRADLYSPEFNGQKDNNGKYNGRDIFTDFMNISNIGVYYEDKFEEYDITHLLMSKKSKLNMFISRDSNYKEIYSDENFVLYARLNVYEK